MAACGARAAADAAGGWLAQQRLARISERGPAAAAFRQRPAQNRHVEGHNVAIEYRWAEGQYDRLPALAADLVRRQVAVIAATSSRRHSRPREQPRRSPSSLRSGATRSTWAGRQPQSSGRQSHRRDHPGCGAGAEAAGAAARGSPAATVMGLLVNPTNPNAATQSRELQAAAHSWGSSLHIVTASTERDLDAVFAALSEPRVGGLVIGADAIFRQPSRAARGAWRFATRCPRSTQYRDVRRGRRPDELWRQISDVISPRRQSMSAVSSRARSPPIFRFSNPRSSSWSSTSRPPRRSASTVPLALLARADEVIE